MPSLNDQNVVSGNVSNKGRQLIIEGGDVCFITGIRRTVPRDNCCAGFTIRYGTYHSQLDFLFEFKCEYNIQQNFDTFNSSIESFPMPMPAQISIYYQYLDTLVLVLYCNLFVPVCI